LGEVQIMKWEKLISVNLFQSFLQIPSNEIGADIKLRNLNRLLLACALAVPFVVIYVLYFGLSLTNDLSIDMTWRYHIFYTRIALVSFLLIVIIAVLIIKKRLLKKDFRINFFIDIVIFCMLLFGVVISAFDQYVTNSITPYIIATVFVALIFIKDPKKMCLLHVHGLLFFYLIHHQYQLNEDIFSSNFVNAISISGISIILSFLFWNAFVLREKQKVLIQKQKLQLEEQLIISEKSAQDLAIANKSKNRFFSIIAHDLRNPIGSIMSLLTLITDSDFSDAQTNDEKEEILSELQKSAISTYNLLENLLFWAKSQEKQLDFNPQPCLISAIFKEVLPVFSLQISDKKIDIQLNFHPNSISVFADKEMLKTILRNLISNALKFSYTLSQIIIETSETDEFVIIAIEDFGVGIPDIDKPKLFTVDEKVSTVGVNNEKGSGLGLILCHEFMAYHNGSINVCQKQTPGSLFELKFPKKQTII